MFITQNVIYGLGLQRGSWTAESGQTIPLFLDIYLPGAASDRPRPAMVLFHGGGFEGGSADFPNMVIMANYFASRGWAVFVVDYRLLEDYGSIPTDRPFDLVESIYPAGRDAKAAVRWLHANAAQYNLSTYHITAMGGSAGAMLALMLGISDTTDYRDEIDLETDPTLAMTNLEAPSDVKTVVSFWGDSLMLDSLTDFDGRSRYDVSDAPTLLFHGTEDTVIPIIHSENIYQALSDASVPVGFYALLGEGHGAWESRVKDGRTIFEVAFDFITEQQRLVVEE